MVRNRNKKNKLTWYNTISNFSVSFCKWVENPPTRHEKSFVIKVVDIGVGVEAVDPEPEFLKLSSIEPRIDLKPVWSDEASGDEDNHDKAQTEGHISSQGSLPVGVGVRKEVVCHSHDDTLTQMFVSLRNATFSQNGGGKPTLLAGRTC